MFVDVGQSLVDEDRDGDGDGDSDTADEDGDGDGDGDSDAEGEDGDVDGDSGDEDGDATATVGILRARCTSPTRSTRTTSKNNSRCPCLSIVISPSIHVSGSASRTISSMYSFVSCLDGTRRMVESSCMMDRLDQSIDNLESNLAVSKQLNTTQLKVASLERAIYNGHPFAIAVKAWLILSPFVGIVLQVECDDNINLQQSYHLVFEDTRCLFASLLHDSFFFIMCHKSHLHQRRQCPMLFRSGTLHHGGHSVLPPFDVAPVFFV